MIRPFLLLLLSIHVFAIPTLNQKQVQREAFEIKVKEYCSKKNSIKGICDLAWKSKGDLLRELIKLSIPFAVSKLMPQEGVGNMPMYMLAHTIVDRTTNHLGRVIDYLGTRVLLDVSRVAFILAGNQKLKNNALKSRLPTFEFETLSPKIKKAIIFNAFQEQMKEMEELYPKTLVEKIRNAIKKYLDFIVDLDIKLSPGGRISQEVIRDFSHYALAKIANDAPLNENSAKQYIQTVFDQRIDDKKMN